MSLDSEHSRILIVEDEPIIRLALEDAFSDYPTESAGTYSEAIGLVTARPDRFRAAVIDIGLPDGRGDMLGDALRMMRPDLPMVFCTAYGAEEIKGSAIEEGRAAVVAKPFVAESVMRGLRDAEAQDRRPASRHRPSVVERAFEVARLGEALDVEAIRKQLSREGYLDARAQLRGPTIRKQLRALLQSSTPRAG